MSPLRGWLSRPCTFASCSRDRVEAAFRIRSEDPGSLTGEPYTVDKDAPFVPEFKNLAMRLRIKEVGIVRTQFGYHVIERVAPPP